MPPVKGTMLPSRGVSMTPGSAPYTTGQSNSSSLGPEAVRATGTGPFDSAYRQNLATYAGGQFQRPGGVLSFNPTAQQGQAGALGGLPTGGGNAPITGSPNSLLGMAIGGAPFSPPGGAPAPSTTTKNTPPKPIWQQPGWQQWLNGLTNQGRLLRGY